ncbi:MAG: exosortase system-associated protein, TIGR04073 family [Candidatus Omnitrophota bacterium]
MKKLVVILCAAAMLACALTAGVFADDTIPANNLDTRTMTVERTPINKLVRGVVNCLTFFVEFPASICDVGKRKGLLAGCTLGVADGLVTSVARLGTGLFDTVTFVIPPYDKPLLKPEYAIDSAVDKMGTPTVKW